MVEHYQPRSKGTWGRTEPKSAEELNRLCNEFFNALVVPPEWKWMGWDNAIDPQLGLISVGKAFRDMRTCGKSLMHYRVWFNSFSCKGGLVSRTISDYGKFAYLSEISNKTVDELNEFIRVRYTNLERGRWWRMRKGIIRKRQLKETIYDYCN